jgi:hypothetical protein
MKKLVSLLFIFLLISLILLVGCFEEKKSSDNGLKELEGLGYINEVYMYGFNPPEGFYLKEESFFNQYIIFEYTPDLTETGQLGLYIYASNISAKISLPDRSIHSIARDLENNLADTSRYNLSLVSYNFKTINGMDFYEILLETPIEQIENHSLLWKYIYVIKDERMINFQIISSSNLYDNHIDDIENSLSSLVVLELEEEEWDLENYYSDDESNDNYIMTAREHYEDRRVVIYFSNIRIFYNISNDGDTIIIQDYISNISYDEISNTTTISFKWDDYGTIRLLYFLFEGDITNIFNIGDNVNITVTLKRVTFSYEGVNYDLELYAESWENQDYFEGNFINPSDIYQSLKPLSSDLIEKI